MKPLGWTLVQCNWCLYMSHVERHTLGNCQVKMEEETGVMFLSAMEGQHPPEGAGNSPSPASFRGSRALPTPLISDF